MPRSVTLPASLKFSLAEARVASVTSWGTIPVKAVLRQDGGAVVARANSRADDWNIAASRLLPAGSYVLDLASAAPPSVSSGSSSGSDGSESSDSGDGSGDDTANGDDQAAQTAGTQGAKRPARADAARQTPATTRTSPSRPWTSP